MAKIKVLAVEHGEYSDFSYELFEVPDGETPLKLRNKYIQWYQKNCPPPDEDGFIETPKHGDKTIFGYSDFLSQVLGLKFPTCVLTVDGNEIEYAARTKEQ